MSNANSDRRSWVLAALDRFEGRLVRYSARLLADEEAARDVVQHAFLRLCDQSPEKLAGREAAWLYTVCRNKALDLLRRQSQRGGSSPEGDEGRLGAAESAEPNPAQLAEAEELHAVLHGLVGELPRSQREMVELWSQGVAYAEIAEITGVSVGNARVTVHRAIARLRNHPQVRRLLLEEETINE
ncbi:MAG: sigma-70 family RNA polymerase sigma factor [Pirellulaceae bacterium]